MGDLLGDISEIILHKFEGFTQKRIKWLPLTRLLEIELHQSENGGVYETFDRILRLSSGSLLEYGNVGHHLARLLEHADRLVNEHGHWNAAQFLLFEFLQDIPNGHFFVLLGRWIMFQSSPTIAVFDELPASLEADIIPFRQVFLRKINERILDDSN